MITPVFQSHAPPAALRAGRFSVWLSLISRTLSQQMLLYARRELGLNLAEYRALAVLGEWRSVSIKDIAVGTQFDKAQVVRAVASLTRRGLAVHTVDARDRRLRVVRLTAAGQALAAKTVAFAIARQKRMERALTASELRAVWKALAALSEEAQAMLAEEAEVPGKRKRARRAHP